MSRCRLKNRWLIIWVAVNGYLDDLPIEVCRKFEEEFHVYIAEKYPDIFHEISTKKELTDAVTAKLKDATLKFKEEFKARIIKIKYMPSLRDIKRRIKSVQNTQQITKAMEMVSAVKLRKAQQRVEAARPYGLKMQQMLESVATAAAGLNHPLFEEREVKTTLLVVFSSDRGLAGSYNSNIIRNAVRYLHKAPAGSVRLGLIGKKAMEYFKRRPYPIDFAITDLGGNVDLVRTRRSGD